MKEWFTYKYGYVNIDSEHLYFTNSGNWSEVKDLQEKGIQEQNAFRRFRMNVIPFALIVIAVILVFFMIFTVNSTIKYTIVFGILVLALGSYRYLKTEIGEKFKLPISKIKTINIHEQTATISFQNGMEESDSYVLKNLDKKGIRLLEEVMQKLS